MPMMFGFADQRRQLLAAELERIMVDMRVFGALRMYVTGDYGAGCVKADTELELVIVQITDAPFHRRPDFWVTHLRPRLGTRFIVYTPEEFETHSGSDLVLMEAERIGEVVL
jgi:hypothetical protein